MQVLILVFHSNSFSTLIEQLCGIGGFIPGGCSSGPVNTNLPAAGNTWRIDIDTANGKVLWWNPRDGWNKGRRATGVDFSNMYHIVMVFGGGTFDLNVDNSFLKTRYNDLHVTYPTSTRISVANGATTRIIGEKITTTSVTSYQLKFTSVGSNMCFGLISASDIEAVTLDGGDFTAHWGVCVGNTYPSGQLTAVCPCGNCVPGCATCTNAASSDCTACKPGYFLPYCSGTCHSSCSVCTGSSNTQCSACASGNFLQPSSTTCLSTCPGGYWKDTTNNICAACDSACSACTGSSNTECSACTPGYFLQPLPSTTCLNSCPSGYGGDSTINKCVQCDVSCSGCTGTGNDKCIACKSEYFLQPAPSGTTCLNSCPTGFWKDTTNNKCMPCDVACSLCSDQTHTQCTACKLGYFLQPSSTVCLNSCPTSGYWQDTTNHICATCNAACSLCSDQTHTQCPACNSGYFLQPAPSTTTCLNSCPSGYWEDTTNHICPPCDPSCSECLDGTNIQCSSCKPGYFLQPSSTICLDSCQSGYWGDTVNHICPPCDDACSNCTDSTVNQCSACKPGYFLQPSSTICLDSCPVGYWRNTTSNTCMECDIACSNCTNATNTECSACNTGYFLQPSSTTCLSSCPNGAFPNSTSNLCLNCDISCALCTGPAHTECSACKPGFFLQPSSTSCLSSCPPIYYYPNTSLHACKSKSNFH